MDIRVNSRMDDEDDPRTEYKPSRTYVHANSVYTTYGVRMFCSWRNHRTTDNQKELLSQKYRNIWFIYFKSD